MNEILNNYKILLSVSGGMLGCLFQGFDSLIYALLMFVFIDYVTGVLLAFHEKKVSSKIGFRGISQKIMIFVIVSLGNIIDHYIIGSGSSLRTMIIIFYISNEGISILENATSMGLKVPQKFKDVLQQIEKNKKI